ncbi:MAG TPA: hypothetical protein VGY66_08795 [Gemmataceae bacterium]|jgi:hypothetical protein|nr:hypothetical protein [Gemmataceae bacterium]
MRWLLKRWWFWLSGAGLVAIMGTGYLVIPVGESSKAKYDKIHMGMQARDVEDLLDCDWTDHEWTHNEGRDRGRWVITGTCPPWEDEDGNAIEVTFDRNSVTDKSFRPTSISLLERMKRRIERRLRALWQ